MSFWPASKNTLTGRLPPFATMGLVGLANVGAAPVDRDTMRLVGLAVARPVPVGRDSEATSGEELSHQATATTAITTQAASRPTSQTDWTRCRCTCLSKRR